MSVEPSLERPVCIVHLEDNPTDQELVAAMLAAADIYCDIIHVDDNSSFRHALEEHDADLIISDFTMPGYTGVRALQLAQQMCNSVPFIFFSGTIGEEAAIESLKNGATDYVLKQYPDRLVTAIRRALIEAREREARRIAEEELNRRDELLRQIMENVEDLIAVVDFEGNRMMCSPSYHKLLGEGRTLIGTNFLTEVHPDDKKRVQTTFRQTVAVGAGRRVDYRLVLADNITRYMEAQGSVIQHNGNDRYVLWVSHDITEHKIAETKILEQAALIDEAHDAICVNDLDQNILFWNKGAERMYGWTNNEVLGRNANELLFHSDVALKAVKTLIHQGEWYGELRQTTRSGRNIVVESRWTLICEQSGRPRSILVINTDITQRKNAEQKIKEQAALLDKAQDAIFVCDLEEQITYWNEGATRLYGWSVQDAISHAANTLLFKKAMTDWQDVRAKVVASGEWFGELYQITSDGREVVVQSRLTLIRNSKGEPESILWINSDITEKKQIEAKFLRTQRMENLGALASGIAHDLNNVLAPIMLAVEIIQDDPTGEGNAKLLDTIATSTRRGSEMVKQILSFARGVAGEKAPVQLRHIAAEVVKLISNTFPRTITVNFRAVTNLPLVQGDSTQLQQVLLNLCVNARDAMPGGGTLTIELGAEQLEQKLVDTHPDPISGQFVALHVTDTGTGIPPAIMAKIFEPFFTTKESGKGTGLGLSTVMGIVKNHGGHIGISSEPDKGTTFHVYLPIAQDPSASSKQTNGAKPKHGKGEQILLVDDEIAIIEIASTTLNAYNYRVITARSGSEAIEVFGRRHDEINLVITDMMMPAMDGAALVRALRDIEPGIKIIAVSGHSEQSKINELYIGSVEAFLNKPFSTSKLLSTLDSVLHTKE